MNDETLILLAKDGQPQAFRDLFDRHRERVFRTAYHYTRSPQDAEDVLQETFIRAFNAIGTFDFSRGTSFSAWVGRICVNKAIEALRKRKREKRDEAVSLSDLDCEPASPDPSPEQAATSAQARARLREAFRELTPTQQVVFDFRYSQHLDIREIAGRMGVSPSSVKVHLSRASARLRRRLAPLWRES